VTRSKSTGNSIVEPLDADLVTNATFQAVDELVVVQGQPSQTDIKVPVVAIVPKEANPCRTMPHLTGGGVPGKTGEQNGLNWPIGTCSGLPCMVLPNATSIF